MQRPFPSLALPRLPALPDPWGPPAVAAALWLLVLLFGADLIAPPTPGAPAAPLAVLGPWRAGPVLAILGFLAGGALPASLDPVRRAAAVGLLALFWGLVLAGYQLGYDLPDSGLVIATGVVGVVLGTAAGALAAPALRPGVHGYLLPRLLGPAAIAAAGVSALVPFDADAPLSSPFAAIGGAELVTGIPQRIYDLIKVAMLWVPLGFVFALGGLSAGLRRWSVAGFLGFLLVSWAFAAGLDARDLLEVLGAPVGIWVGLWIGARTAAEEPAASPARADEPLRAPEPKPPGRAASPASARTEAVVTATPADSRPIVPRQPPTSPPHAAESTSGAPSPDRPAPAAMPSLALPRPHPLALLPALALLALAAWGWWDFPRFGLPLGLALLAYGLLMGVYRHAWLVAVPALLPALDLAPWTGRFFLDEADLFLLMTLGATLLHRPEPQAGPYLARPIAVLGGLFAATTLIAFLIGLFPLSPLDANAFASYFSHYNALRVAKGFIWGLAFFLLLRWTVPRGSDLPARLFTLGMLVGLTAVILIGVRERWQFADLIDFSAAYRITASFSSMHTGGSHLPVFLALAVPFVWLWVVRLKNPLALVPGLLLFAGALYLMVSTVTRAGVLALVVELILLALFWQRALRGSRGRRAASAVVFAAMAGLAGAIVYLGTQGGYFQQRMASLEQDADTRLDHWQTALAIRDQGIATHLFGMGLGRFPETYLQRNPAGSVPGNFRYQGEGETGYLLLGSGETLYLAQKIAAKPGVDYRLSFDLRGTRDKLRLTLPLCEKHLLDSRACVWRTYSAPGSGEWERQEVILPSGKIGSGGWLSRPPVELFLYNGEEDQLVAVDNLSLRTPDGSELLANGDFAAGGDFWFFKTHDHLAWHIKNLWVALLFEQGWTGLVVFNLLMLAVLLHLAGPAWRGQAPAAAALTATAGLLTLGLFSSPFDAPRLTALFLAVLAVGLHATPATAVVASKRRPKLRLRPKRRRQSPRTPPTEPVG